MGGVSCNHCSVSRKVSITTFDDGSLANLTYLLCSGI